MPLPKPPRPGWWTEQSVGYQLMLDNLAAALDDDPVPHGKSSIEWALYYAAQQSADPATKATLYGWSGVAGSEGDLVTPLESLIEDYKDAVRYRRQELDIAEFAAHDEAVATLIRLAVEAP